MIDIPQDLLLSLLLKSLAGGALLGVIYDVIRAFKMLFGVKYGSDAVRITAKGMKIGAFVVTFLTDVIFWVFAGLLSIALIYSVGGGRFRGLTYLALAIGFLIYYLTIGRLMLKISAFLVNFLKKTVRWLIRLILVPFKWVLRLIISLYHLTIGRIIGKIRVAVEASRERKREAALANIAEPPEGESGKEDLENVDEKYRFRKEGRISFGRRPD